MNKSETGFSLVSDYKPSTPIGNMQFEKGMMGVVIVSMAICGAVLAGYMFSAEKVSEEYTAYDYVTDVTSLFDSTNTPEFIDYNPASNFTGYDANDVSFTESALTNNYKITEKGDVLASGTYLIKR